MLENKTTYYALATRGVQCLALLSAGIYLAKYVDPHTQGLFFSFLSFAAMLQLSDMGLAYAALQTACHIKTKNNHTLQLSFEKQARTINNITLFFAALIIGLIGLLSLNKGTIGTNLSTSIWLYPWLFFITTALFLQITNLEIYLLEGRLSAHAAWRIRFYQETLGGIFFLAALFSGCSLWSLPIYWGARTITAISLLKFNCPLQSLTPKTKIKKTEPFNWKKDVWPFQWRMGLSGLSGILVFQSITPIVLVAQGSAVAGQFGMALAIMNMLLLVSTAWPLSQSAYFVEKIATAEFSVLRTHFKKTLLLSTVLAFVLAGGVFIFIMYLKNNKSELTAHFPSLSVTGIFLICGVIHHICHCFAVLLRSQRREVLLLPSVLGSIITGIITWVTAHHYQQINIALNYLMCTAVGLPIMVYFFKEFEQNNSKKANNAASQ